MKYLENAKLGFYCKVIGHDLKDQYPGHEVKTMLTHLALLE